MCQMSHLTGVDIVAHVFSWTVVDARSALLQQYDVIKLSEDVIARLMYHSHHIHYFLSKSVEKQKMSTRLRQL